MRDRAVGAVQELGERLGCLDEKRRRRSQSSIIAAIFSTNEHLDRSIMEYKYQYKEWSSSRGMMGGSENSIKHSHDKSYST